MLYRLELENFILFEKAVFEFSAGLNAVSGETGAGKSLVARALGLALGGRGGHDVIRAGSGEARVRAVFRSSPADGGEDEIAVERTIRREGGALAVNGKPSTAQAVRAALGAKVDFAAQNEHTRLGDPAYQLELLDAYGRLSAEVEAYGAAFRAAESLARRLRAGREEKAIVQMRLERAREDLALLRKAEPDAEADARLEDDIRELSHAAAIVEAAAEAAARLEAGEPSALESLAAAMKVAERMAGVSPRLAEAAGELASALEVAEGALARLNAVAEEVEADPGRLDRMIERSERLKGLAKRFECGVGGLAAAAERIAAEIEELSAWDAGEDEIRKKLDGLLPGLAEKGVKLAGKRRDAAKRLARAVNGELAGLGMERAGFEVAFEPLWQDGMPPAKILDAGPSGVDEVGFQLSPNPGEAASPVAGAVSGGEASRAVLAIKAALSDIYRPELMFLDEVDAGVGARLGRELGVKLKEMAATRQVIVITHLPQIAACAERHLKVAKSVKGGRTAARVAVLAGEGRVEEIASMIHGASAGEVTLRQAREMLAEGGNPV